MKINVEYYGVEGTGRTVKEAKADAGRKIAVMLAGDYVPEVITFQGRAILVWRELDGWYARFLTDDAPGEIRAGRMNGAASHSDRPSAVLSARMQLAQCAWTAADGLDLPEILTPDQYRDFTSWARFQMEYQRLKASGLTETECHQGACNARWA